MGLFELPNSLSKCRFHKSIHTRSILNKMTILLCFSNNSSVREERLYTILFFFGFTFSDKGVIINVGKTLNVGASFLPLIP